MRITCKETIESDGGFGFIIRGSFYKDGVELARFSNELLNDLKFVLKNEEEVKNELKNVLFFEMNDPSLEEECLKVFEEWFLKTRL
jgi:hypothetical protein